MSSFSRVAIIVRVRSSAPSIKLKVLELAALTSIIAPSNVKFASLVSASEVDIVTFASKLISALTFNSKLVLPSASLTLKP